MRRAFLVCCNGGEPIELHMDPYFSNLRLDSERMVWKWCSSKLRRQWERERTICPAIILMGLARITASRSEDEEEVVYSVSVAPSCEAVLTQDRITDFMDGYPDNLLELALFESPKLERFSLDDIRGGYCQNSRLDALAKMTMARERRFGPCWLEEGIHATGILEEWDRCFRPLKSALQHRFCNEKEKLEARRQALLGLIDLNEIAARIRDLSRPNPTRTPRGLLNLASRLKLLDAYESVDDSADIDEAIETLYRTITPGVRDAIERSGYSTEEVLVDFINFDLDETRDSLFAVGNSPRPRLP